MVDQPYSVLLKNAQSCSVLLNLGFMERGELCTAIKVPQFKDAKKGNNRSYFVKSAKATNTNTMRYHCLLFASCILFTMYALDCSAQGAKVDTTFRPHWEIGVDLLPLIDKENAPANSLFARRNYFQKNGLGRAWRLRAGVEVEKRDYIDVGRWKPDTYRTYEPYLSVGHEWQHLDKGFHWFVGVDGFGSYYRQKFKILTSPADSIREGGFAEEYKFGIAMTLGFQIRLVNNLSISSEANFSGFFRRYHTDSYAIYGEPGHKSGHSYELDKVWGIQLRPLYVINLNYSIKSIRHEIKKK